MAAVRPSADLAGVASLGRAAVGLEVEMPRPTHDQLKAIGRNAERQRVAYLVKEWQACRITFEQLIARLKGK